VPAKLSETFPIALSQFQRRLPLSDLGIDERSSAHAFAQTHQVHHCRRRGYRGPGRFLRDRQRHLQQLRHGQQQPRRGQQRLRWRTGSGGGGSNARSGPAAGGASGTVNSLSSSGFTLTTSAGQKVTIKEASSTTYQKETSRASVSAITTDEAVLVLGTTSNTTITATQVIVEPAGSAYTASSTKVIPFEQGTPTTSRSAGQIPADYTEGSGTNRQRNGRQ
jgi:hypothetical protein